MSNIYQLATDAEAKLTNVVFRKSPEGCLSFSYGKSFLLNDQSNMQSYTTSLHPCLSMLWTRLMGL